MKKRIKKITYYPKSFQEVWNAVMQYLREGKIDIYIEISQLK